MTVQPDHDVAVALLELYAGSGKWDMFLEAQQSDGVCAALRRGKDYDLIVFRGSTTVQDWFRDFVALPMQPAQHPELGLVHMGFMDGLDSAFKRLSPALADKPIIVAGHSLGAARAALFAGLLVVAGKKPEAVLLFGCPRPGFQQLASMLARVSVRSYRNGDARSHDFVTDVPFNLPGFPYVEPRAFTDVSRPPPPNDAWGVLAWHHLSLYADALWSSG